MIVVNSSFRSNNRNKQFTIFWKHINFTLFVQIFWVSENSSQSFTYLFVAAPGVKIVPTAAGVVTSQGMPAYQPHIVAQPAIQVTYAFGQL